MQTGWVQSPASGSSSSSSSSSSYNPNDDDDDYDTTSFDADEWKQEVLDLVNKKRAAAGVDELTWDDDVAEAAQVRAEEQAEKFSHVRPDGSGWFTALADAGLTNYSYESENLAKGQTSPKAAVTSWFKQ